MADDVPLFSIVHSSEGWPTARCQDKISSVCGHICENVNFLKFIRLICLEKYGDPPIKGTLWNNKEKKSPLLLDRRRTELNNMWYWFTWLLFYEGKARTTSYCYDIIDRQFSPDRHRGACVHIAFLFSSHRYRYFASASWTYWNIK